MLIIDKAKFVQRLSLLLFFPTGIALAQPSGHHDVTAHLNTDDDDVFVLESDSGTDFSAVSQAGQAIDSVVSGRYRYFGLLSAGLSIGPNSPIGFVGAGATITISDLDSTEKYILVVTEAAKVLGEGSGGASNAMNLSYKSAPCRALR